MAAKFAALEARLNTAVFAHVANTDAVVNGVTVPAIFDAAYTLGTVGPYGMATAQPSLTLPTASVPTSPVGMAVVVGVLSYLLVAHEPDGTGISRLILEAA